MVLLKVEGGLILNMEMYRMNAKLFGTDGYRGPANNSHETGVNPETFERLAYEYVNFAYERTDQPPVVIVGSDTRESGAELREAVCSGAASAGAEVWELGIAPTPVIAWIAQEHSACAVAITASHNPGADNGFKPFDIGGVKPSRDTLDEVEKRYFTSLGRDNTRKPQNGRRISRHELQDDYLTHVVSTIGGPEVLAGKTVVVDGANGAAYDLAPRLYRALGAKVIEFACTSDGTRINKDSGAAHLDGVSGFLKANPEITQSNDFLGTFASDGDGDRVIGVDRSGQAVDGNYWLRQLAIGQVGIVGTIYTNSGLRKVVTDMGVEFHECANGDSYVTSKLLELTSRRGSGFRRGGEFTGHLIDLDHLSSGDGLYMGAWLAAKAVRSGASLSDIRSEFDLWPEKMVGLRIDGPDAKAKLDDESVQEAIRTEQDFLGRTGRIIVRASGTEPLVRIWAEAKDGNVIEGVTTRLSKVLQTT